MGELILYTKLHPDASRYSRHEDMSDPEQRAVSLLYSISIVDLGSESELSIAQAQSLW